MNRSILLLRALLVAGAFLLLGSIDTSAQLRDSLTVIQSSNGEYESCFDFILYNGHRRGTKISELRFAILTDSSQFIAGEGLVESPPRWDAFLGSGLRSISWFAQTAGELDSGESIGGFRVCATGRGVVRIVWETLNIDSLLTRDTLVVVIPGRDCDEPFFRPVPSNVEAVFDVDLASRNGQAPINTFIVQIVTPGVTFDTSRPRTPAGWRVSRSNPDSIIFATTGSAIPIGGFAEGFRIRLFTPRDSIVQIEYITRSFTRELCRDTATIVWRGLTRTDSMTVTRRPGGCCDDIRLKNTHVPGSPVRIFTIRATTPGVRISSVPTAPAGWTRLGPSTVTDSVAFGRTSTDMVFGDTAIFQSLCFDNSGAANDTVRFRYRTIGNDVVIAEGTTTQICLRPLTRCDSVTIRVDSTFPSAQRCITLTVANRNSRPSAIERVTFRISNLGTRRRILSSTPPANFTVLASGPDSVVFRGAMPIGASRSFVLCLSNTDAGVLDPLTVTYTTEGPNRLPLCDGLLQANVTITRTCDELTAVETSSSNANIFCFNATLSNRNDRNRVIDGLQLQVPGTTTIFTSATAPSGFTMTTGSFPDVTVGYGSGSIPVGGTLQGFGFCLDVSQIPGTPKSIPVVWTTFSAGQPVCSDTIVVVGSGSTVTRCDTVELVSTTSISGTACESVLRVTNNALPAAGLDTVLLRTANPRARFFSASAPGWRLVALGRDSALFTEGSLASGGNTEFTIRYDDSAKAGMTIVTTTRRAGRAECAMELDVGCGVVSVPVIGESAAELLAMTPNPFSTTTSIRYLLRSRADVTLILSDALGSAVARIERGVEGAGEHLYQLDAGALPSGIYYLTVKSGAATRVGRLVLVR